MRGTVFGEQLRRFVALTQSESAALAGLETHLRSYRRGAVIRRENDPAPDLFALRAGWLYGCNLLPDGSRQILKLYLAGDMVGLGSAIFPCATETLIALTDVTVAAFDRSALRLVFDAHPRLASWMFVQAQVERVQLTDRLASLGRTPARARVAALLLDIAVRMRLVEPWTGDTFIVPLTQEEMGDMIGLTAVHVNRMMRVLGQDGLIARRGHKVTLLDEPRLAQVANYVDRWNGLEIGWLPDVR